MGPTFGTKSRVCSRARLEPVDYINIPNEFPRLAFPGLYYPWPFFIFVVFKLIKMCTSTCGIVPTSTNVVNFCEQQNFGAINLETLPPFFYPNLVTNSNKIPVYKRVYPQESS